VLSIVETGIDLKHISDIQKWSKRFLIRIYPKGIRIQSDNYNPLFYWMLGCQLVALNYQTHGFPMWLNEGKFMAANRSGYIKKNPMHSFDKQPISTAYLITVKVLSAWRLPRPWGTNSLYSSRDVSKPQVEVSLWDPYTVAYNHYYPESPFNQYIRLPDQHHLNVALKEKKIEIDRKKFKDTSLLPYIQFITFITKEKSTGGHSAMFEVSSIPSESLLGIPAGHNMGDEKKFVCTNPYLDMIVFKVTDVSVSNSFSPMNRQINDIIGYYAITVDDMREGFRVVPLKGENGAPLVNGDLLVYIKKERIG